MCFKIEKGIKQPKTRNNFYNSGTSGSTTWDIWKTRLLKKILTYVFSGTPQRVQVGTMTWKRGSRDPDSTSTETTMWWRTSHDVTKRQNNPKFVFQA